jgi:hypothetical protein
MQRQEAPKEFYAEEALGREKYSPLTSVLNLRFKVFISLVLRSVISKTDFIGI